MRLNAPQDIMPYSEDATHSSLFTGVTSYIGPIMQFVLYNNLSLFLVTIILNIFELSQYIIIILKWLQYGLGLHGHRLNLF